MIMKSIIAVVTLSIVCIVLSFLLGRYSVRCDECITPEPIIKYIKIQHNEKEIEIKRDFEKKINAIDTVTKPKLDSIWTEYAKRYGKNSVGSL